MPNCPECVAREKKALKKQYQIEAEKAEEEGKDYLIPNDRDIGNDIEIPMKLDPSTKPVSYTHLTLPTNSRV